MACALTTGYSVGCKAGIGGLSTAWLMEHSSLISIVEDAGTAEEVNVSGTWRKYELHKNTSSFQDSMQRDSSTGLVTYQHGIDIVINQLSVTMRNELMRLAKNTVLAVVKDRRGDYWLLGSACGLVMNKNESGSGQSASDRSGYSFSLEGQDGEMVLKLSDDAASFIETGVYPEGIFTDEFTIQFS